MPHQSTQANFIRRRQLVQSGIALATAGLLPSQRAHAQQYPNGPVKLYHGYAAGQGPDILARQVAPAISSGLGVPALVESRPGAGERLVAQFIAKQQPDGQSLYLITGGQTVINALDRSIAYNMVTDFSYITGLTKYPFLLVVAANSPFRTLAELLDEARKSPGSISYSTTGVASTLHLAVELICSERGVQLNHIPYRGANALSDLIGGSLHMSVTSIAQAQALIRDGRLRALAVTSPQRWPGWERVPSVAETVPGYDVVTWAALAAPAGTPLAVRERLAELSQNALKQPEVVSQVVAGGSQPYLVTADELRRRIAEDIAKWKRLGEKTGIQASA